jgi:hypothetical protein
VTSEMPRQHASGPRRRDQARIVICGWLGKLPVRALSSGDQCVTNGICAGLEARKGSTTNVMVL